MALVIASLLTAGCTLPTGELTGGSLTYYNSAEFSPESIKEDGLGILPVVAYAGQEATRRPIGDHVSKYTATEMWGSQFAPWTTTRQAISENGLTFSYQQTISAYQHTSILDAGIVRALSDSLGVRFLLMMSLQNVHVGVGTSFSSAFGTVDTYTLESFCQIWDAHVGDVVWEATAWAYCTGFGIKDPEKGVSIHLCKQPFFI